MLPGGLKEKESFLHSLPQNLEPVTLTSQHRARALSGTLGTSPQQNADLPSF